MPTTSNISENTEHKHNTDGRNASHKMANVSSEFYMFLEDIEDIVKATNLLTGEQLEKAKAELNARIAAAKDSVASVSNSVAHRAKKTATVTNTYVHEQPWQAIAVGSIAGFLFGYLLTRRSR